MDITERHSFSFDQLWPKVVTACQDKLPPGWQVQRSDCTDHLRVFRVGNAQLRLFDCHFQRPCPGISLLRVLQRLTPSEMLRVVDFAEFRCFGIKDPKARALREELLQECPGNVSLLTSRGGRLWDLATEEALGTFEGKLSRESFRAEIFGPNLRLLRTGGFLGNTCKIVAPELEESASCPGRDIGAYGDPLGWCDREIPELSKDRFPRGLPEVVDWFARSIVALCELIDILERIRLPKFPAMDIAEEPHPAMALGNPSPPARPDQEAIEDLGRLIRCQQLLVAWFVHEQPERRLQHAAVLEFDKIFSDFEKLFSVNRAQAMKVLEEEEWFEKERELLNPANNPRKPDAGWLLEKPHKLISGVIWRLEESLEEPRRQGARRLLIQSLKARNDLIQRMWLGK